MRSRDCSQDYFIKSEWILFSVCSPCLYSIFQSPLFCSNLRDYLGVSVRRGPWWGYHFQVAGFTHSQELCPKPRVACPLTLSVQSVYLQLTPGAEASPATVRAAFLPVVVFAARREIILLGFALIVMNMQMAVSLRSKCLPGRASWRIRGQDHHKVSKCMLTMVYAPLCCHLSPGFSSSSSPASFQELVGRDDSIGEDAVVFCSVWDAVSSLVSLPSVMLQTPRAVTLASLPSPSARPWKETSRSVCLPDTRKKAQQQVRAWLILDLPGLPHGL